MDLYEEIQRLTYELTASIGALRANGVKLATAERDYKGVETVAELRFKRDVEQANYDANKEHINVTKLKLRLLEAQLEREWGAIK